jgi:hypothetical protein
MFPVTIPDRLKRNRGKVVAITWPRPKLRRVWLFQPGHGFHISHAPHGIALNAGRATEKAAKPARSIFQRILRAVEPGRTQFDHSKGESTSATVAAEGDRMSSDPYAADAR